MSLVLTVDGERWRRHLLDVAAAHPGLAPVCKGNGYGLTLPRLARRAGWIREHAEHPQTCDTICVGTYEELPAVASRFDGDLLVLTPWRPWMPDLPADLAPRVVHTLGRVEDVEALLTRQPGARLVLEVLTSMRRHGLDAPGLRAAAAAVRAGRGRLAGVALHLPLAHGSHLGEVTRLVDDVVAAGLAPTTLWVSHLSAAELAALRRSHGDFTIRSRVGTDLWLGDRGALRVTSRVLDVHPIERGESFGYRGRSAPRSGHLLVVSGGTAHGIGLEAPLGEATLRSRAATVARGGLDAVGFVRSPFSIDGKQRLFAEPPHMQASMLFLPADARVPAVGEELDVRVRYTATDVDRVDVTP